MHSGSLPFPLGLLFPGKGEEQRAAASLACLLCIQLGSGIESEEVFKTLKPVFKTILSDASANIQARQAVRFVFVSSQIILFKFNSL